MSFEQRAKNQDPSTQLRCKQPVPVREKKTVYIILSTDLTKFGNNACSL